MFGIEYSTREVLGLSGKYLGAFVVTTICLGASPLLYLTSQAWLAYLARESQLDCKAHEHGNGLNTTTLRHGYTMVEGKCDRNKEKEIRAEEEQNQIIESAVEHFSMLLKVFQDILLNLEGEQLSFSVKCLRKIGYKTNTVISHEEKIKNIKSNILEVETCIQNLEAQKSR